MPVQGTQPYAFSFPVTKSDTVNIPQGVTDAIFVGGAGAVVLVLENGVTDTLATTAAGQLLPIRVKRINSTNTTATDLHALYYALPLS